MSIKSLSSYLSTLLNREIVADAMISLTSGQRARFISWLEQGGGYSAEVERLVARPFTLFQLQNATNFPVDARGTERTDGREVSVTPFRGVRPPAARAGISNAGLGFEGLGVDIQKISEIVPDDEAFDFRSSPELTNIFSGREISYACARSSPRETLAGLFAGKEAIVKADPASRGRKLLEIEILPDEAGAPSYEGFALSISHSGEYAIAVAIRPPRREISATDSASGREMTPFEASPSGSAKRSACGTSDGVGGEWRRASRALRTGWVAVFVAVLVLAGILVLGALNRG